MRHGLRFAEANASAIMPRNVNQSNALPLSKHTLTMPNPEKWKRHAGLIDEIWSIVAEQAARAERYISN